MSGWRTVFRAECYRALRSRSSVVLLLLLVLVPALRVVSAYGLETRARARAALAGAPAEDPVSSGAGWAPLVDGWRVGLALGALLLLVHALRSVASDREAGLLRLAAVSGVRRSQLVLGRAVLALVLVLCVFVATGAGAYAATAALYDFGPLIEDGYPLADAGELRTQLAIAAALALPGLLTTYAFGLGVSSVCRTSAGALVAGLLLFLGFDLFKETLGSAQYWVFAAYTPALVDGSALSEMSGVARGYSDAGFSQALFRSNLWLPWPQAVLLLFLSCWAVSRRSL